MNNGHETGYFHPGRNVVEFLSFLVVYFFFYFQGFCELIPHNLIQIFDERELEVNMCFFNVEVRSVYEVGKSLTRT